MAWGLLAVFTALVCLWTDFAAFWGQAFARPALGLLSRLIMPLPLPLLEWGLIALAAGTALAFLLLAAKKGLWPALKMLLRRGATFLLLLGWMFAALWLPLYWVDVAPSAAASRAQLIASCESLIAQLNEAASDFSSLPDDLPAKTIRFPFWMHKLGISGFFSFPTGEALVSPDVPAAALPFVAVHESMHARGIAGEGAANLAAWEESLRRGGLYADSARLWALKYSMQALNAADYAALRRQMSGATFDLYRSIGGGQKAPSHSETQAVFAALGVKQAAGDYEILAAWLASQMEV